MALRWFVLRVRHRPDDRQLVGPRAPGRAGARRSGRPATFVSIGLNSPRMPSGASGFMSNVSRWLSPPVRKTRIIDFARGAPGSRPPRPACARRRQQARQPQAEEPREPDLEELATRDPSGRRHRRSHPPPHPSETRPITPRSQPARLTVIESYRTSPAHTSTTTRDDPGHCRSTTPFIPQIEAKPRPAPPEPSSHPIAISFLWGQSVLQ